MAGQQDVRSEPGEEADEDATCSDLEEYCAAEGQSRLWIRTLGPLLSKPPPEHIDGMGGRMDFAYAQMYIAACERLTRILNSDLGDLEQ